VTAPERAVVDNVQQLADIRALAFRPGNGWTLTRAQLRWAVGRIDALEAALVESDRIRHLHHPDLCRVCAAYRAAGRS